MRPVRQLLRFWVFGALALLHSFASPAAAQSASVDEAADRPISEIRIQVEGLDGVDEQLVRNQIRSAVGDPLDSQTVREDVHRLTRLGRFGDIDAIAELLPDQTVALIFRLVEQPIIAEVQTVGNRLVTDQDLLGAINITRGVRRDDFLIQDSIRRMEELYRERGHFLIRVEVDESKLAETGVLIFQILEGPRVRIKAIEFEGNEAFTDKQLGPEIKTRTYIPIFRKGQLDEEKLIDDVAALDRFYRDRGYLNVRVDRRIELSPDSREAKVTYVIVEGPQFHLRNVAAKGMDEQPLRVYSPAQITAMLEIRPGDAYSRDKLNKSLQVIDDAYGIMGYLIDAGDSRVRAVEVVSREQGKVDLLLEINEGEPYLTGNIAITGNFLTKDKVIRHEIGLEPGRPLDLTEINETQRRLEQSRLFSEVRITIQPIDETDPRYRDVLVEIRERNTGSFNFGVGVGSDSGIFGTIALRQDNFDVADVPQSWEEMVRGRAFRGAGQVFNLSIQPGNEVSLYQVSLAEPHFLESDYSLRGTGFFRQREYSAWDEQRLQFSFGVGRRFGEIWDLGVNGRAERVELDDFDFDAPIEAIADAGPDSLTGLGLSLTRSTIGTFRRPGSGSKFELAFEQVGAFGGEYTFSTVSTEFNKFFTVDEDFFGRKSTLKLSNRVSYIFAGDDPPVYEKYYMGGRSFRGFDFRTISPKGTRADNGQPSNEPIGGEWLFFAGAEYEFPIFEEVMTGVLFLDSGTVTDDPGFDDYRLSVGVGFRLYIDAFGPIPIAFDFGFPILKEPDDEEQIISFGAQLPFF